MKTSVAIQWTRRLNRKLQNMLKKWSNIAGRGIFHGKQERKWYSVILWDVYSFSAISLKLLWKLDLFLFIFLILIRWNTRKSRAVDIFWGGRTISAYLPVSFWKGNVYKPSKGLSDVSSAGEEERFTRVDIIQTLHESVSAALNELGQFAMSGLECTTSDS